MFLPKHVGKFLTLLVMHQVKEMEDKLVKLRGGVTMVKPEEKSAVAAMYSEKLTHWRRRKRMFKDLWDAITENSPKDLKQFKVKCHSVWQESTSDIIKVLPD